MQRLQYYPPHFAQSRPYVKALLREIDARMNPGPFTYDQIFNVTAKAVTNAFADTGAKLDTPDLDPQAFALECRAAMLYNAWRLEGGIIYDFDPRLTEALRHSSLEEVCINDLQYPFDTIYFSFGEQEGFVLESGAPVTGAYVYYAPGAALRISLTAPLPQGTSLLRRGYEIYDLGIKAKHFSANLDDAVKLALEDDLEDIRSALDEMRQRGDARSKEQAVPTLERLLKTQASQFEVFRKVVHLVANGLCYASAYREDVREAWPASTPEKLKLKADGQGKEAQRAASKLLAMGFRKVRYLGTDFADAAEEPGSVSPHLRRAHWRNQAYGAGMKLRKLVWIRKTRVLGGAPSEEPRVYKDSAPAGNESTPTGKEA
jgi:hypothetical protein